MRWIRKEPKMPEIGDTRIVTRFLFFPVELLTLSRKEIQFRWLEIARIEQKYIEVLHFDDYGAENSMEWIDKRWAN